MRKHKRSMLLALLLCCVSVVAMAGIYRREVSRKTEMNDLVDLREADEDEAPSEEEVSALVKASLDEEEKQEGSAKTLIPTPAPKGEPVPILNEEPETGDTENGSADNAQSGQAMEETMAGVAAILQDPQVMLNFREDSVLTWPVQGSVLMEYSMDKTVFFNTLQEYKYNPGMLIQGEEGTTVCAGADAVVTKIAEDDELGLTVTMDLGNSYTVTYGQLKALNVAEGDMVASGAVIGLIGAPTKYYSVEGDHVYMELQKDGQPIDPLDYLD